MNVHEETWNIEACFGFVKDVAGNIVAEVSTLTTADAMVETAQFISSAPDMARALLAVLSDHSHLPDCGYSGYPDHECMGACADARAALKKAGIL